jgi:hypothetical protein
MVSSTQKLSARLGKSHKDVPEYPTKCISELIEMFIKYIKN